MTHIDIGSALAQQVPGSHHLVTRKTGAVVRTVIEQQLKGLADGSVVYLDFSKIEILDRSCCDELVAKLVRPLDGRAPAHEGYVVLDGVNEDHLETIEAVLESHGLALVVQFRSQFHLVGAVTEDERSCWDLVMQLGPVGPETVSVHTGISDEACDALLESLARRRLVRRAGERYRSLGANSR